MDPVACSIIVVCFAYEVMIKTSQHTIIIAIAVVN